jgi:hypothetical protein
MIRDQSVQISDPDHSFREPAPDQDPAVSVLQIHVVMGLSPVVPEKQHSRPTFHSTNSGTSSM